MSFNDAGPTVNLKTTSVQRFILARIPPFTMFTTTPFNVLIIINFILLVTTTNTRANNLLGPTHKFIQAARSRALV